MATSQSQNELIEILNNVDISNVESVNFSPLNGNRFSVNTPYMKRLAIYVCEKKGKNSFNPGELDEVVKYVGVHLITETPKDLRKKIESFIEKFSREGGSVELVFSHNKIGIGDGIVKRILKFIFKLILVGFIFWIGGMITCGGNWLLLSIFEGHFKGTGGGEIWSPVGNLWGLWIVELGLIIFYSFYFIFFRGRISGELHKLITLIAGIVLFLIFITGIK